MCSSSPRDSWRGLSGLPVHCTAANCLTILLDNYFMWHSQKVNGLEGRNRNGKKGQGCREYRTGLSRRPAQLSWRRIAWQFDLYCDGWSVSPDMMDRNEQSGLAGASQLQAFGNNSCYCCSLLNIFYRMTHFRPGPYSCRPMPSPWACSLAKVHMYNTCFDLVKFESQTAKYTLHYLWTTNAL